jgi:hypothetical protein
VREREREREDSFVLLLHGKYIIKPTTERGQETNQQLDYH